jgi:ribosomal protein S18 acetylase RimI-like enzyme
MTAAARPAHEQSDWSVVRPEAQHADTIAGWSASEHEAAAWASRPEHPFPPAVVASWWERPDVQPWLLLGPDGVPAAYGELWDDEEEDEVELAHLIVDPARRRQGVGGRLVRELLAQARALGRSTCALRVVPDNAAALAVYRSQGFRDVAADVAAEWNRGQPVDYVWLVHPAP